MGLDMYLNGDKFNFSQERVMVDGFERKSEVLELGYWRKHPDLHGYIVSNFADGVDECQPIYMGEENLVALIEAVENDKLSETTGFFFGTSYKPGDADEWSSYEKQKEQDVTKLTRALTWLRAGRDDPDSMRSIQYQASW